MDLKRASIVPWGQRVCDACVLTPMVCLTKDYLASEGAAGNSGLLPNPGEAPAMLKRNGTYYVVYGHTCCYCEAGSPVSAYASAHPPFVAYIFATQNNC